MSNKIIFLIIWLCISYKGNAQLDVIYFDKPGEQYPGDVIISADSQLIISGMAIENGKSSILINKITPNGKVVWEKRIRLNSKKYQYGSFIKHSPDSTYLIFGALYDSHGDPDRRHFLLKIDENGDTLDSFVFPEYMGEAYDFIRNTDSTYLVAGIDTSGPGQSPSVYEIDLDGKINWIRKYKKYDHGWCYGISKNHNSGFIMLNNAVKNFVGLVETYIVNTDSNGDTLWTKTIPWHSPSGGSKILKTKDGYVFTSDGHTKYDMKLFKIDKTGDTLWSKTYGGYDNETVNDLLETREGNFVTVGSTDSYGGGSWPNLYFAITSTEGSQISEYYEFSETLVRIDNAKQLNSSRLIFIGHSGLAPVGKVDLFMFITDSLGNALPTGATVRNNRQHDLNIFPVPAINLLNIHVLLPVASFVKLDLYDLHGKKIEGIINGVYSGKIDEEISTEHLSPGVYIVAGTIGDRRVNQKIIVMHE